MIRSILWLLAVICIVVWMLGFFGFIATLAIGSFIHVFLVIAVIVILYNVIARKRP
ncbi:lmo0937 family membrane protein [Winogradskyella wichelsiae]|uniref:lmo0937 family membrane protein n=1 Tax=Winogradskyella wichelsiae TaxID=2697007 RepID=UPI003EF3FEAC